MKYKNVKDNEKSYNFVQLLEDFPADFSSDDNYSNKVKTSNLTESQKKIVELIENEIGSVLHLICLKREKTKFFYDADDGKLLKMLFALEIQRLLKSVTEEQIEEYIKLCVSPDDKIKDYIENTIQSDLREFLINQFKFQTNKVEFSKWNAKALKEWTNLSLLVLEEDIVVYAVNVYKKYRR